MSQHLITMKVSIQPFAKWLNWLHGVAHHVLKPRYRDLFLLVTTMILFVFFFNESFFPFVGFVAHSKRDTIPSEWLSFRDDIGGDATPFLQLKVSPHDRFPSFPVEQLRPKKTLVSYSFTDKGVYWRHSFDFFLQYGVMNRPDVDYMFVIDPLIGEGSGLIARPAGYFERAVNTDNSKSEKGSAILFENDRAAVTKNASSLTRGKRSVPSLFRNAKKCKYGDTSVFPLSRRTYPHAPPVLDNVNYVFYRPNCHLYDSYGRGLDVMMQKRQCQNPRSFASSSSSSSRSKAAFNAWASPEYEHFCFVESGALGPFHNTSGRVRWPQPPQHDWVGKLTQRLNANTHMVGSVIECNVVQDSHFTAQLPHVQEFAWCVDREGLRIIKELGVFDNHCSIASETQRLKKVFEGVNTPLKEYQSNNLENLLTFSREIATSVILLKNGNHQKVEKQENDNNNENNNESSTIFGFSSFVPESGCTLNTTCDYFFPESNDAPESLVFYKPFYMRQFDIVVPAINRMQAFYQSYFEDLVQKKLDMKKSGPSE